MLNMYRVRKVAALTLSPLLSVICFYVGIMMYGFFIGLAFLAGGILIGYFMSAMLIKNPFSEMVEGKGILCFNLDSTGMINPFLVGIDSPYIFGKRNKKDVKDVFDREAVFNLTKPIKASKMAKIDKDKNLLKIEIGEEEYNKGRFALFHYPVLIWNDQLSTVLTKDFFSGQEKDSFAEHGVLFLNRVVQDLNTNLLNFGRYIVEQTKPQTEWFKNKWVWIITVILIIILLVLFAPSIFQNVMNTIDKGGGTFSGLSGAVNPVT